MDCDIIRDLMPGCIDGVISEAGSSAVTEHVKGCEECRRIFVEMRENTILQDNSTNEEITRREQAVLDGFKKIRKRTNYFKTTAVIGELLAAVLIVSIFCKVFVWGRLLEDHMVMTSGFEYDEETDSLTIVGYMDIDPGHVSRVVWKENPGQGNRIDLFVYAAENLPFGSKEREFSVTIPNMKGKVVYTVGSDYTNTQIYNWQNDHSELMMELDQTLREHFGWDEGKVMLAPVQGLRTMDGAEGIEYSVFYLMGEDAYYYRINDTYVTHGDVEDAGHVWIALDAPHRIDGKDLLETPMKIDW